jgi:hypothetical protein
MHSVCATYVNFLLFFIDRVPVNATIVNEVAHTVISDEAESPVGTRADHHYRTRGGGMVLLGHIVVIVHGRRRAGHFPPCGELLVIIVLVHGLAFAEPDGANHLAMISHIRNQMPAHLLGRLIAVPQKKGKKERIKEGSPELSKEETVATDLPANAKLDDVDDDAGKNDARNCDGDPKIEVDTSDKKKRWKKKMRSRQKNM